MNLKVFSDKIAIQIQEDVGNPEIFNNLKLLASFFFRGTKFVNGEQQIEEISNIAAEDMYMKIYNGTEIRNPIGYLYGYRYTYLKEMQKMIYSEIIDSPSYETSMAIINMCMGSLISLGDSFNQVWIADYLKRVPERVDTMLSENCRYEKGTSTYNNIYNSILLSMLLDGEHTLFIEQQIYNYFLLMLNMIRNKLYEEIKYHLLDNNDIMYEGNLDALLNILKVSNEELMKDEEQ